MMFIRYILFYFSKLLEDSPHISWILLTVLLTCDSAWVCLCVCGYLTIFLGFPGDIGGKEPACQCRRQDMRAQSLGWEDPLEEGINPFQYSCLENPMDRGAWQATVHEGAKRWTQLKHVSTHALYSWLAFTALLGVSLLITASVPLI